MCRIDRSLASSQEPATCRSDRMNAVGSIGNQSLHFGSELVV